MYIQKVYLFLYMDSNIIKQYNDLVYDSRPVSLAEFMSNKYNIVHQQLFDDAITAYLKDNSDVLYNDISEEIAEDIAIKMFKQQNKIIEIKGSEYWMPSSILIITKKFPYKKKRVDLTKYWNLYQKHSDKNYNDIKVSIENIKDSEVFYIDYVNGIAYMRSRLNNIEFEVPFEYLNNETKVADDYTLSNTFTNMLQNHTNTTKI